MAAASPVRDGERLVSVAVLGGDPMGVLVLRDPDGTAGDSERMAIEHATTVLTIELARLQSLTETAARLRTNLVLELVEGADRPGIMNRAQALGYDLGRPHRVVLADGNADDEIDMSFHAVSRAAEAVGVGSLLAPRLHDVIVLAGPRAPWDQFKKHVVAELHGGRCRIGVGGQCQAVEDFPRSYREAELVSTDLHYNYPMRFELPAANPVVAWYYRYREGSALRARDWERFSDPRRTTYRAYTVLQDGREDVVDGLLREVDDTGYDRDLDQEWVRFLDRWYAPLRFPVHGLQMLAAYVAQMAPASRVTNCAAFQSADELRRVQRIAYRTVQLSGPPFEIGTARHQAAWEDAEAFQPLRELIERALVAYDWGEAFTVTNLVIKPRIDRLVNQEIAGTLATANGDPILASIHFSLDEDARWHRAWTTALLRHLIEDTPANAEVVSGWIGKWSPLAARALEAFAGTLAEAPVPLDANAVTARITSDVSRDTDSMLNAPPASTAP